MICRCVCIFFLLFLASRVACAQNEDVMKQDSVKQDTIKRDTPKVNSIVVPEKDSLIVDSNKPVEPITSYATRFNPRKALLYGAVLPGSGQAYTKKYWKIPLVYAGFGFLIYAVKVSQDQYVLYKSDLFNKINFPTGTTTTTTTTTGTGTTTTPPPTSITATLTVDQLRSIVDQARRQRDYFLIINFFWYILQMVDAHVDAHLKEFDLNPKLQVSLEPRSGYTAMGRTSGIALVLKF